MVFFSDPAAIKQIFTGNPDQLRAGQANTVVFKLLLGPNSILRLDGARHRHERKLLMPPFHGERMRLYGDMMGEIADRSIDTWPVDTSFPFHSRMQDITLDIMLRTVCGVDEGVRLSRMRALMIEMLRLVVVGNPFLPLLGWRRYTRLRRDLYLFLSDEIRRRRTTPPDGRTDIMAMLVAARDEDGRPMSDEEIRDEMITILMVGHETTATSLAWVMHCLLENPNVLETVRAEVASVAGTGPSVPRPPAEEIAQLGYLDAVIKETARLHPVVPIVGRQIETDMRVGDHELPAGSIVAPCIYLTHRRPDLWPDPNAFTPARFVGRRVDPYMFFPFGGGVRHCLGAAFATYEMKIVLARVLSRVTLRPDPDHTVRVVRRGLLLGPSGGVPVIRASA